MDEQQNLLCVWGASNGLGGSERRMGEVGEFASDLGWTIHSFVRAPGDDRSLTSYLADSGHVVHVASTWRALRQVWSTHEPAMVIAFGLRPSLMTRLLRLMRAHRTVLVMARNGMDAQRGRLLNLLDRATWRAVDVHLANSSAVERHLLDLGLDRRRVQVIRSALGDEWFQAATTTTRSIAVAMVGNDRPEKNQAFGLEACCAAAVTGSVRVFTDDGESLRRYLTEHRRTEHRCIDVDVVEGERMSVADYDDVAVLLHPSVSESLPRVVMEARARGCQIVAADTGDTRWAVGEAGIIMTDYDIDSWARAIDQALAVSGEPRSRISAPPFARPEAYLQDLLAMAAGTAT